MITIKSNILKLLASVQKYPQIAAKVVHQEYTLFGANFQGYMKKNFRGGDGITSRTGNLYLSWQYKMTGEQLADIQLTLFNLAPYAKSQEFGGIITPKRAKFLAIPIGEALTAEGGPRYKSPLREDASMLGAFVFTSKAGNLILARREGGDIIPLFVLKSSVTLKPRMGARETLREKFPAVVKRIGIGIKRVTKALDSVEGESGG